MGSSASKLFEIPKFFVFSKMGTFAGSAEDRDFNFKVIPHKTDEGKSMECCTWYGRNCLEKSEVQSRTYTLDQEGYDQMLADLEEMYSSLPEVQTAYRRHRERAAHLAEHYLGLDDYDRNGGDDKP